MSDELEPKAKPKLETLVFEALGEASACWGDLSRAGIFDSETCSRIGHQLASKIRNGEWE